MRVWSELFTVWMFRRARIQFSGCFLLLLPTTVPNRRFLRLSNWFCIALLFSIWMARPRSMDTAFGNADTYLFIYLFMCSCTGSSVKGRLRLPTGASRLRAPVEHQLPSSPRSCVWSPSSYLSSRLSLRCPNSPINGVGSQLAPKLMLHVSCWHQELKCEGSHPPEAAHVLSVFPDRCSANSVFKRQTEKIYSQGTTIKFIFIRFSAEFWFCQAQIKFTAKIHSICRREYKGYSLVFLKKLLFCFFFFVCKLLLSF